MEDTKVEVKAEAITTPAISIKIIIIIIQKILHLIISIRRSIGGSHTGHDSQKGDQINGMARYIHIHIK